MPQTSQGGSTAGSGRPIRAEVRRDRPRSPLSILEASTLVREDRPLQRPVDLRWSGRRRPARRRRGMGDAARRLLPYACTATFLMVLYLRTLLPSVGYHMDTSKFGYLGQVLGTGHPPGEPLYLMLNAAWVQWLPVGTPAWRANLLSAVIAVPACLVLMLVLRELGVSRWVAASGAATIGVSRLFWQQSIVAEVYSLNALFVALVLWLLLAWARSHRASLLVNALGLFALSFSNHPTGLFLLPGLIAFLIRTRGYRVILRPRNLLALLGYCLLTVSTFGYIVWRSLDPGTPYLELDMHSWASFWSGVTAQDFQGYMFGYGPVAFFTEQVPFALWHMWLQYFALAAAGMWGFAVLWRRARNAAVLTGIWTLAVTLFAMGYQVSDSEVFYFVSWMMLGVWIAVGLQDLVRRAPRLLAGRLRPLAAAPVVIAAVAPLAIAAVNYPRVDLSESEGREELSTAVTVLPRQSVVFTRSFQQYQGLNYFLIPGGAGDERHQYAELGSGYVDEDAERTSTGRLVRYCRDGDPMRLEWVRETIPPDLHTFVYGESYAEKVATLGYPVHHVRDELYRFSCDRFGTIGS